jgi:hypothetical protein
MHAETADVARAFAKPCGDASWPHPGCACGKQDVHHLEREDLVALTVESAAMAGVPLAGTQWIPGKESTAS